MQQSSYIIKIDPNYPSETDWLSECSLESRAESREESQLTNMKLPAGPDTVTALSPWYLRKKKVVGSLGCWGLGGRPDSERRETLRQVLTVPHSFRERMSTAETNNVGVLSTVTTNPPIAVQFVCCSCPPHRECSVV